MSQEASTLNLGQELYRLMVLGLFQAAFGRF